MKRTRIAALSLALAVACFVTARSGYGADQNSRVEGGQGHRAALPTINHVLLISIDGMHELDFSNCANGISTVNGGAPYCPNLAALGLTGVNYLSALTSRPSDSFPGLTALVTGATPRSAGVYYDVSYDRALSPPAQTTPYGIPGSPGYCPGIRGTQVGLDEELDANYLRLDGGGGINPNFLPRDPNNNCAPVYPHTFLRVNTMFEVIKAGGGYTAWTDKHPSYDIVNGPSGTGVNDLYTPEINSQPVNLPGIAGCNPLPDPGSAGSGFAWTDSFQNIQCYDTLKVNSILNEINGRTHDGKHTAPVPSVFGMNFQVVSVGQKLHEKSLGLTGGYLDPLGTPSASLLGEIQWADTAIGQMVGLLKTKGLLNSTLIIVTAKHGQSAIDPNRVFRIPADDPTGESPATVLGGVGNGLPGSLPVAQAIEDDVSLIWLLPQDQSETQADVTTLSQNENLFGQGEIFSGPSIDLIFNSPATDSRTPDIVVAPNVGVVYTGGTKKVAEHGGFAEDDRHVMMLVSNPSLGAATYTSPVETRQVAPTIVQALGLNPNSLQAVQQEGTQVLPSLF